MGLTTGRGPLSSNRAGYFWPPVPGGVAYVEPHRRRVQAILDGQTVIDTERALIVHRPDRPITYAFPADAVRGLPTTPVEEAPDHVEVAWDAVDSWIEEGRTLVHYPPSPYHRVDCRPTRRPLKVSIDGAVLVDTDDTVILFETGLPARLYVDPSLVRMDLLRRTDSSSWCNYKGTATYWAADIDGVVHEDVAWSYEDPLPESTQIGGFLSFDPDRTKLEATIPEGW